MKPEDEEWSIIDGYPDYAISRSGHIVNVRTGKTLRPYRNSYGLLRVSLYEDGERTDHYVHRLVEKAFSSGIVIPPTYRYIKIVETGQIFRTIEDCAHFLNSDSSCVYRVLRGDRHTHKGYTFVIGVR